GPCGRAGARAAQARGAGGGGGPVARVGGGREALGGGEGVGWDRGWDRGWVFFLLILFRSSIFFHPFFLSFPYPYVPIRTHARNVVRLAFFFLEFSIGGGVFFFSFLLFFSLLLFLILVIKCIFSAFSGHLFSF